MQVFWGNELFSIYIVAIMPNGRKWKIFKLRFFRYLFLSLKADHFGQTIVIVVIVFLKI